MNRVAVRLPEGRVGQLDALVPRTHASRSAAIRRSIEVYRYRLTADTDVTRYEQQPLTDDELAPADGPSWRSREIPSPTASARWLWSARAAWTRRVLSQDLGCVGPQGRNQATEAGRPEVCPLDGHYSERASHLTPDIPGSAALGRQMPGP